MPGTNGHRRAVHFADRVAPAAARAPPPDAHPASDSDDENGVPMARRRKRPRPEYNADEIDDVDDWKADEDDDGEGLPTEHELLEAKRERRLKRELAEEEEDTHIDRETSLADEGITVEPFSMEQEKTDGTGYFDGDTYVFRQRSADEEPDAWLESLADSKQQFAKADTDEDEEEDEQDDPMDNWTEEELYAKILPLVSDTETVTQAIVRYGKLIKRRKGQQPTNGNEESRKLAQSSLNELTEAANALLLKGQVDIYQKTRNDLLAVLPEDQKPAAKSPSDGPPTMFEYMGSQDQQIHGPFTAEQMLGWIQAGYFVGPSAVKVRTVVERPRETSMQDDLMADLMDDEDDDGAEEEKKKPEPETVRGEWQMSDKVDYSQYTH